MAERLKRFTPTQTDKEALTFHLIFAIAFAAFLLEAVGRRLLLRQARAHAGDHKSIIAEAKAAAGRCVPFASWVDRTSAWLGASRAKTPGRRLPRQTHAARVSAVTAERPISGVHAYA